MPKFVITLKDPDGVSDSVCDAATEQLADRKYEMTSREYEDACERRGEQLFEALKKWVTIDDRVRIEIDTDAGTARVLEVTK